MALHTSLVRACWGAKEGTARRRRWHTGGDRMGCGAAAVIDLHAVPGTIPPILIVPMPSAWSSAWPWTRGKYGPGHLPSSLHRTQAAPACRLRSRATPGRSGCGKAPLTAWVAWARVPMGKYHKGRTQGPGSGCASPASHRHLESGRAAETVPACRKWRALSSGCRWRVAARLSPSAAGATGRPSRGLRQGKSWSAGQVWRSWAISSAVPVGASSGARCHMTASTAHVEKGHARGGGVHLDGPLWARPPHAGCVEHSSDHVRCQDQHHSRGPHNDPLRGTAVAAPGVQGHCRLARVGNSVDGLLDVHAAACGLNQDPALRHPAAQGGACGRVSHRGQCSIIGAGLGVLLGAPAFAGAVAPFPRGAEGWHAACRRCRFRGRAARGGLRDFLQVRVRARVLLWGVAVAASESQRPDDLVCCIQRRRSGACFAWGRGFGHWCVAVPKGRGRGADFPWLVSVLWARRGAGGGARTLVPRAGVRVCVWALGALLPLSVVTPLRGASEAGRSPFSSCLPPRGCRGPLSTCCRHGCAGLGPSTVPVACMPCEGRLVPGVVPPPPGRAGGVPRPVCPGRGRCGCGEPAPARQCAPLRAGVARCGGCGRGSPGGVPFTVVRGVCGQALPLSQLPALQAGCLGPSPTCCGRGCAGVGAQHCPFGLHALCWLRAAGVVGGRPRGGWPATVVRGVWCQALSLPRPPILWGGQRGSATRVSRVRSVQAWGPRTGPTACALARRGGGRRGVTGEGRLSPLLGAPEVRRSPSPDCPPTGRAVGVRHPCAVGAGVRVWGPNTVPLACMPFGGCVPRGWWGAIPGGAGLPLL